MANDAFERAGMYFDDLNRIRVLDDETSSQAAELKDCCQEFLGDIEDFQKIADSFISIFDTVSQEVEREKIKSIGGRNLLKSYAKQREAQQEQLRALIVEKKSELDRLTAQYTALSKLEAEQQDFMDQFILQK
ncbi:intraflagellar transport protein 20 homolog [Eurytemora carolleeae]|uniref:intraflagellar transport protein 20 homolog n=1 Tax=Eurytemora carolleeae TaxID=1294199 RepID=UPI000C780216|nr:intraflagellar transport protein 20 homolog [Eurytemora carolleeae]XP_023329162.1 intraflagellar transport protein 20 homolog [Eurytemora carolleeae]XP_023329163.1 intraflagellar transport protein 20 homolog [Eurytemora carolleeae]|eukprot:XP_023329155.1 intraflagellar transport protein 20 homolog [Eurytemora affinis]